MNFREWALPVYTIMVQMATGALLTLWILRAIGKLKVGAEEVDRIVARPVAAILLTIVGALMGSHLHLSRPFLSFLALGNLGSSWLSREVLFTTMLFVSVAGLTFMEWYVPGHERLKTGLGWFAIASGAVSIFCMAAIYLLPIQPAWNTPFTVISFYATALLLGILETAVLLILDLRFSEMREPNDQAARRALVAPAFKWFAAGTVAMAAAIAGLNVAQIQFLQGGGDLAKLSLELLLGLYRPLFMIRFGLLLVGAALLGLAVWTARRKEGAITDLMVPAYISCLLVLVGEILGRFLFYATHIRLGI